MNAPPLLYGVIDETSLTFYTPRAVDSEHKTLIEAFTAAGQAIIDGAERVSIVRCRYSERHESFVEVSEGSAIEVDARYCRWASEDDDGPIDGALEYPEGSGG